MYHLLGKREAQADDLEALEALAQGLDDRAKLAEVALRQASYSEAIGDYPEAVSAAQKAVAQMAGELLDRRPMPTVWRRFPLC